MWFGPLPRYGLWFVPKLGEGIVETKIFRVRLKFNTSEASVSTHNFVQSRNPKRNRWFNQMLDTTPQHTSTLFSFPQDVMIVGQERQGIFRNNILSVQLKYFNVIYQFYRTSKGPENLFSQLAPNFEWWGLTHHFYQSQLEKSYVMLKSEFSKIWIKAVVSCEVFCLYYHVTQSNLFKPHKQSRWTFQC